MRRPSHILWLTFGLDCKQQRISALRAQTIATHVRVGRSGFGVQQRTPPRLITLFWETGLVGLGGRSYDHWWH